MNPRFFIFKLGQDAAKQACERCKERRNPSADAHEMPMSDGEALPIVPSWARPIRYRPSLPFSLCTLHFLAAAALATGGLRAAEPNIRVCVQLIELSHPELTKLLGEPGTKLHPAAMALAHDGRAKLIDSSVLTTLAERKATAESIGERIYPSERDYGGLGDLPPPATVWSFQVGRPFYGSSWTIWVEYVDEWGDASDRRPTFTTLRCNTSFTLAPGRFALAAVLTPQPEPPPPAVARKVLVFVRAICRGSERMRL